MDFVESFFPLLVLVVLVVALVAAIVGWRRREGLESEAEAGIGRVRRLYFYFGTFVYMIVAGTGAVLIGSYVLDELFGPTAIDRDVTQLALGVALALIWTPVWLWHRVRVERLLKEEPAERTSVIRKVAVYLALGVTLGLTVEASTEVLRWVFGARSFGGYGVMALLVWGGLWAMTWRDESLEGQPTDDTRIVRRLYLYITSGATLAMLAGGASIMLYVIFREAYEGVVSLPVLARGNDTLWSDETRATLAVALTGGVVWATHWLVFARRDAHSDMRQFYLYLAILAGVVTTLSAAGVLLYGVLQWGIGTPEADSAGMHFRFVPAALAPLLVGLVLWGYHWAVVREERAAVGELGAARRIYGYLVTVLGLGALIGAVIVLVSTVIGLAVTSARDELVGPDWWRDRMTLVLTLALVGGPLWALQWFPLQGRAVRAGTEERQSLPRRIFLYGIAGAATLTFLGSVSYLLFVFLNAVLEDKMSLTLLRDAKWSIGTLVAAGLFAPYHWLVLQEDRKAAEEAPPAARAAPAKSVTLLIAAEGLAFVPRLEAALGTRVRVLDRADPGTGVPVLSDEDIERLKQRIAEAPGSQVLLVADAAGVQVFSYR
ncbi:MAG: DUF5671 domain-containing protein [Dehalococcoidia bacterium]